MTRYPPLPPHVPSIMPLDRPPSHCNSRPPTPTAMMLSSVISFYEETINDPSIAILTILKQASYQELYVYFAYEVPFDSTLGETQAGNDYVMRKLRGLHADDILQYEAEWNACFLWNSLHQQNVMEEFPPYKEEAREIEIQEPMLDAPPVAPPRAPVSAFSYIRGQAPPGTYAPGYLPFAGTNRGGRGGGQPAQPPQPPAPPPRYCASTLSHPTTDARPTSTLATSRWSRHPPMMNSNLKFSKRSTTSRAIQMTSPASS